MGSDTNYRLIGSELSQIAEYLVGVWKAGELLGVKNPHIWCQK